jgi:hypothetical protein
VTFSSRSDGQSASPTALTSLLDCSPASANPRL